MQLGGAVIVIFPLCLLDRQVRLVNLLLDLLHPLQDLALPLELRFDGGATLTQVRQLLLKSIKAILAGGILLLAQRLSLDLEQQKRSHRR